MDSEAPSSPPDNDASEPEPSSKWRALRIWPAAVLLVLMVVTRKLPILFEEESLALLMTSGMGPVICGVLILIWWLSASRATGRERLVGAAGLIIAFLITAALVDHTMRGPGFMFLTGPIGMAAFAIGAVLLRRNLTFRRTWIALLLAACGFGSSILFRNSGMSGDFKLDLHWRFKASPEERLVLEKSKEIAADVNLPESGTIEAALANPDWPQFRGRDRSGAFNGPAIQSNWDTQPPELLWKIPVGPGWSSFSVAGDFLFTQEQRGPSETVVCYRAETGDEVWTREIESRFDDPLGGPGPRATPTLSNGGVFVLGAEGWLMRLEAGSGDVIWKQDLRETASRKPPMWGFASSPLVTDSLVVVHAGGAGDKGVLAFDIESGDLKWSAASGDHSYSSPQLTSIGGEDSLLMLSNRGLDLLDPQTGVARLEYGWPVNDYRALQPAVVGRDSVLLATTSLGTRRIRISKSGDTLAAEELWTSSRLKPDFNDFVVYKDHAYGFHGSFFTCIDLETGELSWKGGRYGKGQVLLLEKSGLLLVASERGEVVLLKASPEAHQEVAKFQALEGKTWNHPVVVGERLFVRNSQEAACYRLPMAATSAMARP